MHSLPYHEGVSGITSAPYPSTRTLANLGLEYGIIEIDSPNCHRDS